MKRRWLFVVAPLALAAFVTIGGLVVQYLWNWLLPALFGLPHVTFWQALGLLALCRILFGGLGGGSHRFGPRRRLADRWERMTPEEREKSRAGLRSGCGGLATPAGGSSAGA